MWTTNESGGSETVIDSVTAHVRGTVDLGGEVGNVAYDPVADQMLVAVQGQGDLAAIDPGTVHVTRRLPLPGCRSGHGLALDPPARLAFVACEGNATLLTVDLETWQVTGTAGVGKQPDVLAYDQGAHRLYVASESGTLSMSTSRADTSPTSGPGTSPTAHTWSSSTRAPTTPSTRCPPGADGRPALLERAPVT